MLSLLIYFFKDVLESAVILLQDGVLGAEWKEVFTHWSHSKDQGGSERH